VTATAAATSPACPRCGRVLPFDAPAGLCPRCLLSDGFGGQSEAEYRVRTGDGRRFVPPTTEELAGEFPNLEFVRPLGSGGMGAVYLAKQVRLDRPIAVKVLPPDLADDPAFAERFLREARALARLSHPNIVGVFDFGQTPGGLYFFLMEYIEGPTLRQVVASRSTDPKQALEIVRQVCDALQFAHDKGVVHRDIKPENILLDGHGRVKIADFGLAKLLGLADAPAGSPAAGSLTHTQQAMGTPHYMAPEQIIGSRGVDHRADIYSLGVVFYELLTGDLPLGRFAPPSKKVQVDVRLDEVVLRSLESEPALRYQHASDVRTAVDSIASAPPRGAAGATAMRFVREASSGVGSAARTVLQPAGPGDLSRKAMIGLLWAGSVPLVMLSVALYETFERNVDVLAALFATIGFVLAIPAFTAPIGTTVLGTLAVREIRGSNGRVAGLVPALAAVLLFPLLFLDFLFLATAFAAFLPIFGHGDPAGAATFLLGLPLAVGADVWLVRAAWRKATEGMPVELVERESGVIPSVVRSACGEAVRLCAGIREGLFGGVSSHRAFTETTFERPMRPAEATSLLSRKATVGAVWAAAFPVAGLLLMVIVSAGGRGDVHRAVMPWLALVALPAATAPFGTTALGWMAVGEIRRSKGRVFGLPLAVFDGLVFPLLVVDVVIAAVVTAVTMAAIVIPGFRANHDELAMTMIGLGGAVVGVLLCVIADVLIARAVWRRASGTAVPAAGGAAAPDEARRGYGRVIAVVAVVSALVVIALYEYDAYTRHLVRERGLPATITPNAPAPVPYDPYAAAGHGGSTMSGMSSMGGVPGMEGMGMYGDAAVPFDSTVRWYLGPNGVQLGEAWAASALGIDYEKQERINAVLRETYAAYERALDAHTTVAFEGRTAVFTVAAFPEEYDRLADEFWTRVDAILDRDQQAVMRYNFPLRYDARQSTLVGRYEDKLMPLGDDPDSSGRDRSVIRIGRSGQWYEWSISLPDVGTSGETPELPRWLGRWQERFEVLSSLRRSGAAFDVKRPPLVAPKPGRWREAVPAGMGGMMGSGMMDGSMDAAGGGMGFMMSGPSH